MHFRKCALRFGCVFVLLFLSLFYFTFKLICIQCFRSSYLAALADKQHNYGFKLEPVRGTIFDRRLRPIAVNIPVQSLYANPRRMTPSDKRKALENLPAILSIPQDFVKERLNRRKYFVWLARKLPDDKVKAIKELNIKGLAFLKDSKRHYPNNHLAAHLIGFAGTDNEGLEGLELQFNSHLKGKDGWSQIIRDARQRELLIEKNYIPPQNGFNLVLTIDETIQYIAEQALDKAYQANNALGGSIIVLDPRTGEILALANRPTYSLDEFDKSVPESRTNRALAYVYEPGSVFKIVAASAALEEGVFTEEDKIFCENGAYKVGNHILHDYHPYGTLTFQGVIENSSNIGVTKIAQKMGPATYYKYAKRFRFGMKTGVDMVGEVEGWVKPPAQWSKTTIGAMPIGQEVTVTPLQLVCAIGAIANDGVYMKPYIVKYITDDKNEIIKAQQPQIVDRVISQDTARRVTKILTAVVEKGTGKMARIKDIPVAGKTGTAQKVINGQYSGSKFFATFIGFVPADKPRLAMVVMFDDPHPNHFGGTVAAPVFKEVAENALKYLDASGYN